MTAPATSSPSLNKSLSLLLSRSATVKLPEATTNASKKFGVTLSFGGSRWNELSSADIRTKLRALVANGLGIAAANVMIQQLTVNDNGGLVATFSVVEPAETTLTQDTVTEVLSSTDVFSPLLTTYNQQTGDTATVQLTLVTDAVATPSPPPANKSTFLCGTNCIVFVAVGAGVLVLFFLWAGWYFCLRSRGQRKRSVSHCEPAPRQHCPTDNYVATIHDDAEDAELSPVFGSPGSQPDGSVPRPGVSGDSELVGMSPAGAVAVPVELHSIDDEDEVEMEEVFATVRVRDLRAHDSPDTSHGLLDEPEKLEFDGISPPEEGVSAPPALRLPSIEPRQALRTSPSDSARSASHISEASDYLDDELESIFVVAR